MTRRIASCSFTPFVYNTFQQLAPLPGVSDGKGCSCHLQEALSSLMQTLRSWVTASRFRRRYTLSLQGGP